MFVCLFVCYLADSLLLTLASRNTQTLCSWNISPKKRLPRTKLWRKTAFALEPIHLEKSSSRINIHKWEREKITRAVSSKRGRVVKWSQGKWKNCDSEGTKRGGGKRRRDKAERRFRRERGGEVCRETGSCFCLRWASRPWCVSVCVLEIFRNKRSRGIIPGKKSKFRVSVQVENTAQIDRCWNQKSFSRQQR